MTLVSRASSVPWTGVGRIQMMITFLGISLSASGPTSPSSSYWRKGQNLRCARKGRFRSLTWQQSPFFYCSKIGDAEEKANASAKALDMSLLYSFVTPLTSMVVTKPETDDSPMIADKLTEGGRGL